jgi:hypothetical protein
MRKMMYTSNRRRETVSALYRFLNVRYIQRSTLPAPIDLQYKAFYDRRSMKRLRVISGLNVSKVNAMCFFFFFFFSFFFWRTDRYSVINSAVGNKCIGQTTIYNEFGQRGNSGWIKPRIYYSPYLHRLYEIY